VVSILLTFCNWKVVFSLFLILHRAFSHFMYLTFCQFRNRKMVQSWFRKLFWNQDCDVVGNLVVEIEIFHFCLFVCLLVCLFLTFCQFRKRKMVQSWFQKLFWNQDCDVVSNLVVEIENFNFCLFVCLLFCLYLTFCQFRNRKMVQSWFQKLFWNQGCDAVLNLAVEFSNWNF